MIVFFRQDAPERRAFAVIKARRIVVSRTKENEFSGDIKDFFSLMGDVDYVSSEEGMSDRYVLCWFDDKENDFTKAWRRLIGVTFPDGVTFTTDRGGKRTYNARFKGEHAKLES